MRLSYLESLKQLLQEHNLDAMLLCPSEELKFLTGFTPMMCERFQGLFVRQNGTPFYVCNLLYAAEMEHAFAGKVPVYAWFDNDGMWESVVPLLEREGLIGATVGVNSTAPAFNVLEIASHMNVRFVNGKPLLEEWRIHKSEEELQHLRKAASIADAAYEPLMQYIRPGITEAQVRDFLFAEMRKGGGKSPWAIVASGPNSSYPHYSGSERVLQIGDAIVLDYGCAYEEMQSDMSRTVFLGSITDEQREIYELVDRAQLASQHAAKEGAWIPDVDQAARTVLDEKGYAKTLINRVGHGIGYMMHEAPDIKKCNPRKLERGMVFSVEPGVYLPGRFGMRIENIVAINHQGTTEILNKASRELKVISVP